VRHLSDGALRRLYDEPYALDEETRAHYRDCSDCQARFTEVADDARHALTLLAVPGVTVDPAAALARTKAGNGHSHSRLAVLRGTGWRRPAIGGLLAAALVASLAVVTAFTPLAATLQSIFQPTQVTPIVINQGDLTGLNAFSTWGDAKGTTTPQLTQVETAAEAAKVSGLPELKVDASKLPAALAKAPVSYAAVGQGSGTVTFNSNAPAKLHGATLSLTAGPAETAVYGDLGKLAQSASQAKPQSGQASGDAAGAQPGGAPNSDAIKNALQSVGPLMAVAEMKSPRVTSTGASVADIKAALLAQPGLSPSVRQAIQSIDNPQGNLPLPIPAGMVTTHAVKVQGANGTAFGDNTGLGAGVIFIKNGKVFGVAGTITEDQALAVANSLH
jgi:hypothetical protein